jgi:hypothetical protein
LAVGLQVRAPLVQEKVQEKVLERAQAREEAPQHRERAV